MTEKNNKKMILLILLICIFIVVIIMLVLALAPLYYNKNKKIVNINNNIIEKFYKTSEENLDLINLLHFVVNLLKKNNITFWLVDGSLLGYARHKGIIPWDFDCDIGIFDKDKEKVNKIFKNAIFYKHSISGIKKLEYNNICNGCGGNVNDVGIIQLTKELLYNISGITQVSYIGNIGNIDIIPYIITNDKIVPSSIAYKFLYPSEYFNIYEFYPLIKTTFENIEVLIPNNYDIYLNRLYPNWENEAYIDPTHLSNFPSDVKYKFNINN